MVCAREVLGQRKRRQNNRKPSKQPREATATKKERRGQRLHDPARCLAGPLERCTRTIITRRCGVAWRVMRRRKATRMARDTRRPPAGRSAGATAQAGRGPNPPSMFRTHKGGGAHVTSIVITTVLHTTNTRIFVFHCVFLKSRACILFKTVSPRIYHPGNPRSHTSTRGCTTGRTCWRQLRCWQTA